MIKVDHNGENYFARCSFDERKNLERAGFRWSEISKRWETPSARHAYRLFDHCNSWVQNRVLSELDLPRNLDTTIKIKYPARLKPFKHQFEFTQWVLSRRASYIAGEAGTGKTPVLPMCMNTVPGRAVVFCPSFLKLNWEDEIENWSTTFKSIQVLKKQKDDLDPDADVYVAPDSLLPVHEFREKFFKLGARFEYLFIDEAHRFKSADARRTMSLLGARSVKVGKLKTRWGGFHKIANRVVAMSGTPMPNRPVELFPLISRHALHAVNYFDPHRFGVRYCDGFLSDYGWDYTGASNLEELNRVLCRNYMFVKRLADCVDLPPKLPPKMIYVDDSRGDLGSEELKILKRFKVADLIRMEAERSDKFRESVTDKLEERPELSAFGFISELRKLLGIRKVGSCIDAISSLVEDHGKVVVFCWHSEVADHLVQNLARFSPLKITGKTPMKKRHDIVKDFQTKDNHKVLVGNILAMGVGLTLTASHVPVFVEPSWVPGDNDQAINRCYRIGQKEIVRPMFFVVKNSLDHLILNAHQDKKINISSAIKPLL